MGKDALKTKLTHVFAFGGSRHSPSTCQMSTHSLSSRRWLMVDFEVLVEFGGIGFRIVPWSHLEKAKPAMGH